MSHSRTNIITLFRHSVDDREALVKNTRLKQMKRPTCLAPLHNLIMFGLFFWFET